MSANTSNDSLLHPNFSSISFTYGTNCLVERPGSLIFTAYNISSILLLLPLCVFILHVGFQRWRRQCSTSTAATMSHSDCFTYHMVTIELIGLVGQIACCCGIYKDNVNAFVVGYCLFCFTWFGEMFFQILTCVEHHLAVVHPITYLSLRSERGIRIRNITIGCVWLLCFGSTGTMFSEIGSLIADIASLVFSMISVSFCSLSVLCVLIRPGPREQSGDRQRVDQSKQRAFYTILVVLALLVLRFSWGLVYVILYWSKESPDGMCVVMVSGVWFVLPSSLVLPLLFLHRAGMLVCCKNNTK